MRLIDADELIEDFRELNWLQGDTAVIEDIINEQPTIEAVPVVHGEWVNGKCSICGACVPTDCLLDLLDEEDNYFCYRCGADMRKKDQHG